MFSALLRVFVIILLSLASQAVRAEKTDVVYLQNGDRITGEVKSLFRGKLEFSTDHMDTVFIEWEDIREIVSTTGHAIELTNGQRFYGPLTKPEDAEMLVVKTADGPVGLNTLDVISIYPVESSFWERLDLSASLGFSWDKGSKVGKYSLGIDAVYRRTESITRSEFSSEITTQEQVDNTARTVLSANHLIFMRNKNFRVYFGNLDQNDELGVNFRALAGAGYGWIPMRSQKNWFSLAVGLDINREIPVEGESETNLEAAGLMVYEYFKYSTPERSLKTNLTVFPSITDIGRWRIVFSTDFSFEIVNDLFWKLDFYANYDSAPISTEGATSDYGVVSSIAYKF